MPDKAMIRNPVLPGFHPDPSICRVGNDYYIAVSTFEWYPGVRIYRSGDLASWTYVTSPLNRTDLLDMRGAPDSCGVWAPCLTHADGRFWLAYTDVKRFDGNFKDTHNYLTTCEQVDGDWSERLYMNSSGFDPSLFHDDDGRKYWLNMIWDHRPDRSFFGGIVCQEFDAAAGKLLGAPKIIFTGTKADCTEGPHIYKRDGYYYLMTAEGGTGYNHAVTLARSRSIWGPYEVDPAQHMLTARDKPDLLLQRAGHGSLVETPNGEFYLAHLCSRPIGDKRRSPLGRETAIQKVVFSSDGWLRLEDGSCDPVVEVPALGERQDPTQNGGHQYSFEAGALHPDFQWLRTPEHDELFSLTERPGYLRLFGWESLGSFHTQALVARRQTDLAYEAATCVSFEPNSFQQAAGLVCYYNSHKFHYFFIGFDEDKGKYLGVMSCEGDLSLTVSFPLIDAPILVDSDRPLHLKVNVMGEDLNFAWRYEGEDWSDLPLTLDAGVLSDEAGKGEGANFTGAFVGMCCQDLTGAGMAADFQFFSYRPL